MAIPEHRPFAGSTVDDDDGELIGGAGNRTGGRDVDARLREAVARKRAQIVAPEAADVARAPAETGAHRDGGRDLAARQAREALEPLLAVARRVLRDDREKIDAVQPEADDVESVGRLVG